MRQGGVGYTQSFLAPRVMGGGSALAGPTVIHNCSCLRAASSKQNLRQGFRVIIHGDSEEKEAGQLGQGSNFKFVPG